MDKNIIIKKWEKTKKKGKGRRIVLWSILQFITAMAIFLVFMYLCVFKGNLAIEYLLSWRGITVLTVFTAILLVLCIFTSFKIWSAMEKRYERLKAEDEEAPQI